MPLATNGQVCYQTDRKTYGSMELSKVTQRIEKELRLKGIITQDATSMQQSNNTAKLKN